MKNTPAAWDERARTAPTSWEAASWSRHSQDVRFHVVRSLLKISAGDGVLDFGCGTGAFIDYLPSSTTYFGLDWSPEMRARARAEHPRAITLGELDDDLVFDHVVCIGAFNLSDNWSKEKTWETLEELWTMHTRCSLVVSLYRAIDQTPSTMLAYTAADLAELLERLGSPSFVLRGDHLSNDLVIGAYRVADRHGAPAELPARDVGRQQDPRV